jgi:hypothetical protein
MEQTNNELEITVQDQEQDSIEVQAIEEFKQAEWVFQFDDEEPVVFAWINDPNEPGELNLNLKPNNRSDLQFTDRNGRSFKIFAREITEPTLKMIEQSEKNVIATEQ